MMNRKQFIQRCSVGCVSLWTGTLLLEGCASQKMIQGILNNQNEVRLEISSFYKVKKEKTTFLKSVILKVDTLDYPILVYRNSDTDYKALLLKCTHQGTVLSAYGELISCPAHGSEFNSSGSVIDGPAKVPLTTFPTLVSGNKLIIKML